MILSSARLAIVGAASSMLACCLNRNSPDYPGTGNDNTFQAKGVNRWSVSDARTGERIARGCDSEAVVTGIAPGRQLVVERWSERASVESSDGLEIDGDFWCSDHPRIHRQLTTLVDPLECWQVPEEAVRTAARVLELEVLPPEGKPATDEEAERHPDLVPGRGYRFTVEVLRAGHASLISSGACDDTNRTGRVQFKDGMSIVRIECGPATPCAGADMCTDAGGCAARPCDGDTPCPQDQVCVSARCALQAEP